MSQQPWKTDQWFVSPWDFESAVRDQLHFPSRIQFHDITLRDGEQQTGVIFTKDDKIRIAEALAEAGVHRIEAGMPVVSTRIGAEGLAAVDGEICRLADDAEGFARATLGLLSDPENAVEMARRARAEVVARRDMRTMTQRLVESYREQVGRMR